MHSRRACVRASSSSSFSANSQIFLLLFRRILLLLLLHVCAACVVLEKIRQIDMRLLCSVYYKVEGLENMRCTTNTHTYTNTILQKREKDSNAIVISDSYCSRRRRRRRTSHEECCLEKLYWLFFWVETPLSRVCQLSYRSKLKVTLGKYTYTAPDQRLLGSIKSTTTKNNHFINEPKCWCHIRQNGNCSFQ